MNLKFAVGEARNPLIACRNKPLIAKYRRLFVVVAESVQVRAI